MGALALEYHVKFTLLPQFSNNELLQYGRRVMSEIAILMATSHFSTFGSYQFQKGSL